MSLANIAKITNTQFWDMARRFSPSFASHTSEGTKTKFDEAGFEQITLAGTNVLNEFFEISMRIAFQMLNISRARNPFVDKGLVQVYDTPNGGFVQRMAVHSIKPVSPAYNGLKDGDSVDPFVVRKAEIEERFFAQNFDYQSLVTVQDFQMKTMFVSEYGMGELLAGILQALANGYTIQEYVNVKACIDAAINSTKNPLKASQIQNIGTFDDDEPTTAQLTTFLLRIKNVATSLEVTPQTGAYNAMSFESIVDPSDMVLLLRSGIKSSIDVSLMVGAFNPEYLSLPFEIVEVDDFGGVYYQINSTRLYPVYDALGTERGLAEESQKDYVAYKSTTGANKGKYVIKVDNTEVVLLQSGDDGVVAVDPNANVLGMLAQRGAFFENAQNPYTVEPIRNPRGIYNNYWANRPKTGINYDALYNLIVFTKTPATQIPLNPDQLAGSQP